LIGYVAFNLSADEKALVHSLPVVHRLPTPRLVGISIRERVSARGSRPARSALPEPSGRCRR
jgi:hypothetical protein